VSDAGLTAEDFDDHEDDGDWRDYDDDDYRESDPEDYEIAKAEREHSEQAHDGRPCDCPVPTEEETAAYWAEQTRLHNAEYHDGGDCDCEPPF
jgi:hypothetical protein